MKTFVQELQHQKELFEAKELPAGYKTRYDKPAMLEVLEYLKVEIAKNNGGTVYNESLALLIAKAENIPSDLYDHLKTEVYLAQHDYTDLKQKEHADKMLSLGYIPLTSKTDYRGKIELIATYNSDWFTNKIAQEAKIITAQNGTAFIVPKGKRSRGWYVYNLENAFYKPLTK